MYGHLSARHWIKEWHERVLASRFLSKFYTATLRAILSPQARFLSQLTLKSNKSCFLRPPSKERHLFSSEKPSINLHYDVDRLDHTGAQVDVSTYASLLRLSAQACDLSCGKRIHDHLKKRRWEESSYL
eukprot:c44705_g1_i1 orf=161-547(+)